MPGFLRLTLLLVLAPSAHANICGIDFQNFNPTTGGLDFVTVHSSETLSPCLINMGFFVNHSRNSLSYIDKTSAADFSLGFGITRRWEVGLSLPAVLQQDVDEDMASYDGEGFSEFKGHTKLRLWGNGSRGIAAILSFNHNLVKDNPFTGRDPGLTWNYEVAADTLVAQKWAIAINAGYRSRHPGEPIPNTPIVPLEDQFTYSLAGSFLLDTLDTKIIAELMGSYPAKNAAPNAEKPLKTFEALLGIKHDFTTSVAGQLGFTKQLDDSTGGPDWSVYAGLNWTIGPVCEVRPPLVRAIFSDEEEAEVFTLNTSLLFRANSDTLDERQLGPLNAFLDDLGKQGFDRIVIVGHTDSVGDPAQNMQLSLRHAQKIAQYMIDKHKFPADKIEAKGLGATHPIADNGNFQDRQKNRRIELRIWRSMPKE